MRWLLFLSKVAFICNLFFILCLLIRHTHITVPQRLIEFVLIEGWLMSVVFNVLFGGLLIMQKSRRKPIEVEGSVLVFNFAAIIVQISYYIIFK